MTATILDGKAFGAKIRAKVADHVTRLVSDHDIRPGLAVVLVGEDPASQVYVRNKGIATKEAGMKSVEHKLPADVAEADLYKLIDELNADPTIHGILVQFPVPDHLSERDIVRKLAETPGQTLPQTVAENMTRDVVTCGTQDTLVEVLRSMSEGRFRHMPVVEAGMLKGMVTIGDVVNYRLNELEHEALQLKQLIVG